MAVSAGFKEFLIESLAGLGPVAIRHMFGGGGVYADGVMFGLIADDVLYLKADDGNRGDFEAEGMAAFVYSTKDGHNTIMSYWRCPERLLDEPDEMVVWAQRALAAARRSGTKAKARKQPAARPRAAGKPARRTKR